MIKWIARHLPRKIRLQVAMDFLQAAVELSPKGMDSTIKELHDYLAEGGHVV
jgi:hypothetical protein